MVGTEHEALLLWLLVWIYGYWVPLEGCAVDVGHGEPLRSPSHLHELHSPHGAPSTHIPLGTTQELQYTAADRKLYMTACKQGGEQIFCHVWILHWAIGARYAADSGALH